MSRFRALFEAVPVASTWPQSVSRRNSTLGGSAFRRRKRREEFEPPHVGSYSPAFAADGRFARVLIEAEAELNDRVYRLFELSANEITLLQKEAEHQGCRIAARTPAPRVAPITSA